MSNTELSEFFSLVSKEKNETLEKLKTKINNPESDLANLFEQLEDAHKETTKVSIEVSDEKILTEEDQNRLEVFSNLVDSMNTPIEPTVEPEPIIEPEEPVDETEKITAFEELFKKFAESTPKPEPEPIVEITPVLEDKEEKIPEIYSKAIADPVELLTGKTVERTGNIIHDIVSTLDDLNSKTEVKEEVDQIAALRGEFDKFRNHIQQHISHQDHSGAGSGEVRLEFLDDVNTTGQEDGDVLTYNATTGKYELKSSTSTVSAGQLLEETDGDNIVFTATDASGSDGGDDVLLESGVGGSRDIDQTVLQILTTDIIPQQGGKLNLGSPTKRFQNIYLEAETIDLDGATITSDGSGTITISADGVTLPTGSKDAEGFILARTISEASGATFKLVSLFTQASGLTTAATQFKFNARKSNTAVYTDAGHVFTLSNGDARSDSAVDLFQF